MGIFKEEIIEFESLGKLVNDTPTNREKINNLFMNLPDVSRCDIPGGREMTSFICYEMDEGVMHGCLLTVQWIKSRKVFLLSSKPAIRNMSI